MNILTVGGGGREHALAWKLRQSPKVKDIFIAPGNAGTAEIGTNIPISKTDEIIDWLKRSPIDLVVIGPDNYLAEGMTDRIQELGISVFGPTKAAAEIEWSKSFAKRFMREEGIPTADYEVFTDLRAAREYVRKQNFPLVVKASGLALGKGVYVAENIQDAEKALADIMDARVFGDAGNEVVIEEYLRGKEVSIHAFCDGESAVLFPAAQDHKRIFDGERGPNTGGMGTIAPVPWVTSAHLKEIEDRIVLPTLRVLKRRGRPFRGVLFPGVMITDNGPKVIEFNARFGDPETQSYMRILDTDLIDILFACINGTLKEQKIQWSHRAACCVVIASGGYPGAYETGRVINGLENVPEDKDIVVFHAGTKSEGNIVVTNGGRVLGISATGSNLAEAVSKAYARIESISFDEMQYRKDIGTKSL